MSAERRPLIALAALAFVLLNNVIASTLVIAAYGFDLSLFADPGALVGRQLGTADLLRWGALIDLLGYLALAPVVLYMYGRHRDYGLGARLVAFSGLGFVLVGAIGAALLGSAGPWLLQAPTTDAQALAAARTAFASLQTIVVVGLWGTLEQVLLAGWLIGSGWWERAENRAFGYVGAGAGFGALGYALRTGLIGAPPLPIDGPLDVAIMAGVGLLPIWILWLAVRLLKG
jgi:hypothetical protein